MGYSEEKGLEFASRIYGLRMGMGIVSNSEIATALGLDSDGMNSALAILSAGIELERGTGDKAMNTQSQLLNLGVTLGRAYERKVAGDSTRDESERAGGRAEG